MSAHNFMSYENAATVLGGFADEIAAHQGVRTIAGSPYPSSGTQTMAEALAPLYDAYAALSKTEQCEAFIYVGGSVYKCFANNGMFASISVTSDGWVDINAIRLAGNTAADCKFVRVRIKSDSSVIWEDRSTALRSASSTVNMKISKNISP